MRRVIWVIISVVALIVVFSLIYNKKIKSKDIDLPFTEEHSGIEGMENYFKAYTKLAHNPRNPYAYSAKLEVLLKKGEPTEPLEQANWNIAVARAYLNIGDQRASYPYFEKFFDILNKHPEIVGKEQLERRFIEFAKSTYAIAYMRQAEVDNCMYLHTDESCIFPIRGKGIHTQKEGATNARSILIDLIEEDPENSADIWIYNIVNMALGMYPDSVPEKFRLNPSVFESDTMIPRFIDVAHNAGVAFNSLSGGVCMEDFDNDGYLDVITSGWQLHERVAYFHNNGDGTFDDWSQKSNLGRVTAGLNMLHADYNGDGWKDVLVLRGGWWDSFGTMPNSLLRNNGDGTFEDVTWEAGLHGRHASQTARFADFNNDGHLDLFVGNEATQGSPNHPCELYINNGDGTFKTIGDEADVDVKSYVKGVAAADFDNDGDIDIYLSAYRSENTFLKNMLSETGELRFEDVTEELGVEGPMRSFPTWFFDFDNDGDSDLFVASFERFLKPLSDFYVKGVEYPEYSALYRNNGNGTFTDIAKEVGLKKPVIAMGSNFGDIDNDGFLDMYLGTGFPDFRALIPNIMFRNTGSGFQDVTTAGGFGHLQKGHGIAFGDMDMDGDQDVYAVMGGALLGDFFWNALFENPGNKNDFVNLKLEGTSSNFNAIGAKIKAVVTDSAGSQRTIYLTHSTGGSFGSSPLIAHLGLGPRVESMDLTITWPNQEGTVQTFTNVPFNGLLSLKEGDAKIEELTIAPPFQFSHESMSHSMH